MIVKPRNWTLTFLATQHNSAWYEWPFPYINRVLTKRIPHVHKERGPYVVNLLNWPPIFEWRMVRLVVENGHQKDKFDSEIGVWDCMLKM